MVWYKHRMSDLSLRFSLRHSFIYSIVLMVLVMLLHVTVAHAQAPQNEQQARQELASRMATMTLAILKDTRAPEGDRKSNLERSFAKVVDTDWIAKFVLGSNWRKASEEQRNLYTELYRNYLAQLYVSNYAENPDRKVTDIKVLGVTDSEADDTKFTARTEVVLSNAERLKVDYLVSGAPGQYKIVDVIIEGVSLLATHRAEFSKIAANKGIGGVIEKLKQNLNS